MSPMLTDAVFLDCSDCIRLRVVGPDRAKFLHNVTTNDVKRLALGRGVEAFVTSLQGKTLGFVTILASQDSMLVRTDAGALAPLLSHFQKYSVFDDVTLTDLTPSTFEFHVAGAQAEELLSRVATVVPEAGSLRHGPATIARFPVQLVRESPLGAAGISTIGDSSNAETIRAALRSPDLGVRIGDLNEQEAEALRIEAGTPRAGRDVLPDNLPQELGRDALAINFVKGCYLGQETVARIDALGHVNRHLRGFILSGGRTDVPAAGSVLEADGKPVGVVTSSAFAAWRGCPVALGYVRTARRTAGTVVQVASGERRQEAVVANLPMPT